MKFEYTDGHNKDFIELCHGLDEFLNELVGGEENRAEYIQYNKLDDIHDVVIAYDNDIPVGSASFKKYDDENAEVKRVFVKEEYRKRGYGKAMLAKAIALNGPKAMMLLVNVDNAAAIALYESLGFVKSIGENSITAHVCL